MSKKSEVAAMIYLANKNSHYTLDRHRTSVRYEVTLSYKGLNIHRVCWDYNIPRAIYTKESSWSMQHKIIRNPEVHL